MWSQCFETPELVITLCLEMWWITLHYIYLTDEVDNNKMQDDMSQNEIGKTAFRWNASEL